MSAVERPQSQTHLGAVREVPVDDAVAISVLVPVRDEAESLEQLVAEVRTALDSREEDGPVGAGWELILVDDGSADASWDEIVRLSASEPRVRGLQLRRNFGKSAALAAAVEATNGDVLVTIDGDLQDDPAEVPDMIARLTDPADLLAGHKAERRDPLSKRLPSKLFNAVTGLITGLKLRDHNCGLKVARREVFEGVPLYGEMHRFLAAISHAQGFRVVEHSVNHRPRIHGNSKFGLERYLRGAIDLLTMVTLTRYGRRPAHLFGGVGLLSGTVGMACLLYLTGVWFLTDDPIGTRPLLLFGILLVLLAVQMFGIGLLAEFLVHRDASHDDVSRHVVADTDAIAVCSDAVEGSGREALRG